MLHPGYRNYERMRAEGCGYVETQLIIARKLLRIAFALLKQDQMYQPDLVGI